MKHRLSITLIILGMFLVTQFIGLWVVNAYSPIEETIVDPATGETRTITRIQALPYGMQPPEITEERDFYSIFPSLIIAFVIAITLILILSKYKWRFLIRVWFFVVVALALGIAFTAFLKSYFSNAHLVALLIAIPFAYFKIRRPNVYVHNFTELLIYPGIAAVFVGILNIWTAILFLILISIYDIWAVWHSGVMQKMAKFQMEEVGVFGGFMIPSMSKKVRQQIKKLRLKYKGKKIPKKIKGRKFRVSLAILGGGDVIFPIITAGVFMRAFGLVPALFVTFGAFAGLLFLLSISKKKKFYPAMPFITAGIFAGMILSYLIL